MASLASVAALVASQDPDASVWDVSVGDGTDLRSLRPGFVAFASLPWFPPEIDTPPFTVEPGPGGVGGVPACRVTSTDLTGRWGDAQGWGVFLLEMVFAFSGTAEVWAEVSPTDIVYPGLCFLGHMSYSSTAGAMANTAGDGAFSVDVRSTAGTGYNPGGGDILEEEPGAGPPGGATTPLLTGWHLYTVTWDGTSVFWYVDGVLTHVAASGNYEDDFAGGMFTFFRGLTGGVMLPLLSTAAHTAEQIRARYDLVVSPRRTQSFLGLGLSVGAP